MSIWHLSWEVFEGWTDEQFNLMRMRAAERIHAESNAVRGRGTGNYITEEDALASGLFTHGNRPR